MLADRGLSLRMLHTWSPSEGRSSLLAFLASSWVLPWCLLWALHVLQPNDCALVCCPVVSCWALVSTRWWKTLDTKLPHCCPWRLRTPQVLPEFNPSSQMCFSSLHILGNDGNYLFTHLGFNGKCFKKCITFISFDSFTVCVSVGRGACLLWRTCGSWFSPSVWVLGMHVHQLGKKKTSLTAKTCHWS